jgi:predicted RNA-binding protein with PUA-like domain
MRHWLVKSEPTVYSFAQLTKDGRTRWDGVRNNQARLWLGEMKRGDRLLYYHSQEGKEVVGIAEVVQEAYQDPTATDGKNWLCVDIAPVRPLARPVPLQQFRDEPLLASTYLVRQGRLSVMPVTDEQFARVVELGGG